LIRAAFELISGTERTLAPEIPYSAQLSPFVGNATATSTRHAAPQSTTAAWSNLSQFA